MKLNRLHAATMAPSPSHVKTREEKGADVRPHQRARRSNSDDNGRPRSAISESRITTIPEITECFEKRLCLRDKEAVSEVSLCVQEVFFCLFFLGSAVQQKSRIFSLNVSGFSKMFC